MRRRALLGWIGLLALGCGSAEPAPSAPPLARPDLPSILLVTLDTVRADHVGAYGYPRDTTPYLDTLAAGGVVFETAYAPTGATAPSHASLFTGRWPIEHGVVRNGAALAAGEHTLVERLRAAGWRTAAFVGAHPLARRFGFAQGFDHYDDAFAAEGGTFRQRRLAGHPVDGAFDRRGEESVERALAWLAAQPRETRLFVWLHLFDPHAPYDAPGRDRARFAALGDDARERSIALYDGEIRHADRQLEQLHAAFAAHAGRRPQLVVVAGDHGEGLWDHGWRSHNRFLYDEELRVPWVVHGPGRVAAGRRIAAPVSLVDAAPTLLGLIGIPETTRVSGGVPSSDAESSGRDRSSWLRPGAPATASADPVWLQRPYYERGRRRLGERGWGFGLRVGRWKYIEAADEGRVELYDLERDPGERTNRAEAHPEVAAAMAQRLANWRAVRPEPAPIPPLDSRDAAALAALGYLDGDDSTAAETGVSSAGPAATR